MGDQHAALLAYFKANGRACPQPKPWSALWEMLPERRRVGNGWEPALPLILAAWWETAALRKHLRFLEHLEWASAHGCIEEADPYVRALREPDWHHFGD